MRDACNLASKFFKDLAAIMDASVGKFFASNRRGLSERPGASGANLLPGSPTSIDPNLRGAKHKLKEKEK